MVRLGFFTGKLYDSSVDPATIKECALLLDLKDPVDENDEFIAKKRAELKERCSHCCGCPESRKGDAK